MISKCSDRYLPKISMSRSILGKYYNVIYIEIKLILTN